MKTLTRKDLDASRCASCDNGKEHKHDPIFLHGRCHIKAGTWVSYVGGVISVECCECGAPIAKIKVAEE